MPRITITVSDTLAVFLESAAAAQKRSLSAEASLILENSAAFKEWLKPEARRAENA